MKILITVHTYIPNRDGVQFVTKYLAEGLVKKKHDVTIITYMYKEKCNISEEIINGVKVIRWKAKTKYTFHIGNKKEYQKYILNHQDEFDVMINVGTQTALTDWLFPIFDKINIPSLLYIHSIWDFKIHKDELKNPKKLISKLWANIRWYIYYNKNKKIFKSYSKVTQLHEKDYSYRFFDEKYNIKSNIIENAVEENFFCQPHNKENKYIINVSNYNLRKNQKKCIELYYCTDIPDDWQMILIGSSKNKYYDELVKYEEILRTNSNTKKEKVRFLYNIPREKICDYVKESSLYLMTSTWEAFPISLIEAMASGVPFISSNVGIVKFLEGGVTANSTKEYKELLYKFTTNAELRKEYGIKGYKAACDKYRIEDKVNQLEIYLYEIIGKEKKR